MKEMHVFRARFYKRNAKGIRTHNLKDVSMVTHDPNKLAYFKLCGLMAYLVEHYINCTGIAVVKGSNPVEVACMYFLGVCKRQLLQWTITGFPSESLSKRV